MASVFPGGLDNFTNPTASDTLDSATVPHATQHANVNDAVEAIESTLGVNPQGASATVVTRLGALDTTVAGKAPASGISPTAITGTAVVKAPTASQTITNSTAGIVPLAVYQSGAAHTLTTTLASGAGEDTTALNVVSSNSDSSAVWISGKEYDHGTLKIAHLQPASGSDANAAAISINLACDTTRGPAGDITETQGIYLDTYQVADNSIKYGTTGALLNIKNAGVQKLVLNANGQLQLPMTTSDGGLVIGGDTRLWRSSAGVLRSGSTFYLQSATSNAVMLYTTVTSGLGPAAAAFSVQNNGKLSWGASVNSSSVMDSFLYRTGVNALKTDGSLTATSFIGALTGNVTGNVSGSSGSTTGNAATATTAGTLSSALSTTLGGTGVTTGLTVLDGGNLTDSTVTNAKLVNSSVTVNGSAISLGG